MDVTKCLALKRGFDRMVAQYQLGFADMAFNRDYLKSYKNDFKVRVPL